MEKLERMARARESAQQSALAAYVRTRSFDLTHRTRAPARETFKRWNRPASDVPDEVRTFYKLLWKFKIDRVLAAVASRPETVMADIRARASGMTASQTQGVLLKAFYVGLARKTLGPLTGREINPAAKGSARYSITQKGARRLQQRAEQPDIYLLSIEAQLASGG